MQINDELWVAWQTWVLAYPITILSPPHIPPTDAFLDRRSCWLFVSPPSHPSASPPPMPQACDPIQANGMCGGDSQTFSERISPWQMHTGDTPSLSNSVDLCQSPANTAAVLPPWGAKPKDQACELRLEKVWVFKDIVKTTLNLSTFRLQVA